MIYCRLSCNFFKRPKSPKSDRSLTPSNLLLSLFITIKSSVKFAMTLNRWNPIFASSRYHCLFFRCQKLVGMERDELNTIFIIATIGSLILAIIVAIFLYCCSKICQSRSESSSRMGHSKSNVPLIVTTKASSISIADIDEFIDERSTHVISAPGKINSLHDSNMVNS